MPTCKWCFGPLSDMSGSPFNTGPRFKCMNGMCSSNRDRGSHSSYGGGGGNDWLHKPCATPGCPNEVHYKEDWDHPPSYCKSCKENAPRAGSFQRDRSGNLHEYHGRGYHRSDGGIEFSGGQSDHSHQKYDSQGRPIGGRGIGETKWKKP